MILFPAIDIKNGKVVRLTQGDYAQVTEYFEDPVEHAKSWADQGIEWLHVVDLDAAKAGRPVNRAIIEKIVQKTSLQVQIGGGIRQMEMAQEYLRIGVARIVVGTQAVREPKFLEDLGQSFPNQVALGLDTKEGMIAVQGWTEATELKISDYLQKVNLQGIACLIFTDISRDGMLQGPNIEALQRVLEVSPIPVIASGGVSQLQDLTTLQSISHDNLLGVIVGKALYENKFSVADALGTL